MSFELIQNTGGIMKEGKTFGKRYEKKYLVNGADLLKFIEVNQEKLRLKYDRDHFLKDSKHTIINNIYFDSNDLDSYQQSMLKTPNRSKLRLRTYAENGVSDDLCFFEIKSKDGDQTLKSRIVLKTAWIRDFITIKDYPVNELLELNALKRKSVVFDTIDSIYKLIHEYNYRPVLQTHYKRWAFKLKENSSFRLTIDMDLEFTRLSETIAPPQEYTKTWEEGLYIVELKSKDQELLEKLPEVSEVFNKHTGFSKYCYGVYSTKDVALKSPVQKDMGINKMNLSV